MSETDAAPLTPPTRPGPLDPRATAPLSRTAVWAMVCGIVGLLVPLVGVAGIVLGIVALRRIEASRPRRTGRGIATAGIACGGAGLLVTAIYAVIVYGMVAAIAGARTMIWTAQVQSVHAQAQAYAKVHDGYPAHVAELVIDPDDPFPVYENVTTGRQVPLSAGEVVIGDFDFVDFATVDDPEEAVRQALAGIDTSEPYYRFGAWWFVRLPEPTGDPRVIYAWRFDPQRRWVYFIMDEGSLKVGNPVDWPERWADDAAARTDLELPALPEPDLSAVRPP